MNISWWQWGIALLGAGVWIWPTEVVLILIIAALVTLARAIV